MIEFLNSWGSLVECFFILFLLSPFIMIVKVVEYGLFVWEAAKRKCYPVCWPGPTRLELHIFVLYNWFPFPTLFSYQSLLTSQTINNLLNLAQFGTKLEVWEIRWESNSLTIVNKLGLLTYTQRWVLDFKKKSMEWEERSAMGSF